MLVEQRGGMRGHTYAENTDVIIFEDEMMMGLLRQWNGVGGLGGERCREQKREKKEEAFHERIVYQLNESLTKARVTGWTTKPKR